MSGYREVFDAGAMGVVDSGLDLVLKQDRDPYDAAEEILARGPVLGEKARRYLISRGLADVLREVQMEGHDYKGE